MKKTFCPRGCRFVEFLGCDVDPGIVRWRERERRVSIGEGGANVFLGGFEREMKILLKGGEVHEENFFVQGVGSLGYFLGCDVGPLI